MQYTLIEYFCHTPEYQEGDHIAAVRVNTDKSLSFLGMLSLLLCLPTML
jgi:hypothetical protein